MYRRELLEIALPFAGFAEAIKKRGFDDLSTAGKASIVKDVFVFAPPLLAACSPSRPKIPPTVVPEASIITRYDGPIEDLRGLELVSDADFRKMTLALQSTNHPFLRKVASGLTSLRAARVKPPEFPEEIDSGTFPFTFVVDNSSNTSTAEFHITQYSGDRVRYLIPSEGIFVPQEAVDKYAAAIKLGLAYTPVSQDPLLPALLLTKEYLSLLHAIAFNSEMYDIAKEFYPNLTFTDTSGQVITDPLKLKSIGMRVLANNLADDDNVNWRILDGFGMLLTGVILKDLVVAGRIKNESKLTPLVIAANTFLHSSPESQKVVTDFMESWRAMDGFIFPVGTGAKTVHEPIFSMVLDLEKQIFQSEHREFSSAYPDNLKFA